jgi:parvulin-like peptidyl-prolyl isomerase
VESLTEELRTPLSELPELTPSEVISTSRNFQIVQVEERVPMRTKPFEEVQDELKQQIQEKRQRDKFKRIIDELKATAVIETILDEETAADPAGPAESEDP